jgi:hypothetical protein
VNNQFFFNVIKKHTFYKGKPCKKFWTNNTFSLIKKITFYKGKLCENEFKFIFYITLIIYL